MRGGSLIPAGSPLGHLFAWKETCRVWDQNCEHDEHQRKRTHRSRIYEAACISCIRRRRFLFN
jgi:hypothetical protein